MPMKIETNTDQGVPSPHSGHFQDETLTAVDPLRRSSSSGDNFNEKGGDYKMKQTDSPKDTFHEGRHRFGQDIIPPYHDRRTVVLCFDGTGDQFDDDNSNVVNFFSTLKKDDPCNQIVYYQAGIGTYTIPQVAKPMAAKFKKLMDTMVGVHLDAHVMSGYEFLMQNYQDGDKICIFGFSRGAYTARALAGMLHKVGLLPKSNYQQVPFAYRMYSREDELGWRQSILFKKSFSIDVDIEILGVWDTVGSVGILPKRLPFTTSNTHVRFFRHALSLDERRVRFTPSFWHRPTADDFKNGIRRHHWQRKKPTRNMTLRDLENAYSDGTKHMTDVEEVWFAGCHCDVGGGAVVNDTRHALARIPLRWMIRQCFLIDTGILFHRSMLKVMGLEPDSLWPVVKPRAEAVTQLTKQPSEKRNLLSVECMDFVSEEEEDLADILCKKLDMLEKAKSWWILEVLPQKIRYQRDLDDVWTKRYSINLGKGRLIPKQSTGVKVHRSVKILMDKTGYKPKAQLMVEPTWVS